VSGACVGGVIVCVCARMLLCASLINPPPLQDGVFRHYIERSTLHLNESAYKVRARDLRVRACACDVFRTGRFSVVL
jgi:hypothetical protein